MYCKVGHFTMDNTSNNETMMKELERLLRLRDLPLSFDAADRKVMCFSHVIDLSSGRVISGLTNKSTEDDQGDEDDDTRGGNNSDDEDGSGSPAANPLVQEAYEEAITRDPIALSRAVVRVIRASGTRRDAFDDVIVNGNAKGWFRQGRPPNDRVIAVKQLQLLRDVRTRWDSLYYMLNRLRELRPVRHSNHDQFFSLLIR